ncbi:MAG: M28 family metallopeptidase [Promethearchaeota archaeon]
MAESREGTVSGTAGRTGGGQFDEVRMFNLVEKFSFPRLVGSSGELKARQMVVEEFREAGLEPVVEEFRFSTHFANFYVRGSLGFLGILFLLYILADFFPALRVALLAFGVAFASYSPYMVYVLRHPEKARPVNAESANVYCRIPPRDGTNGMVVLSAHYDTKSQRISVWARCIYSLVVLLIAVFGAVAIVVFEVLRAVGKPVTPPSEWVLRVFLAAGVVSAAVLSLNKIQNESLGSVDNAAGMSIVFELARWLREHPLEHFEVWACVFGAEELGTMGSRFFLRDHLAEMRTLGEVYDLNFDMVDDRVQYLRSRGMFPPKPMCRTLGVAFEEAAGELGVPWSKYSLIVGASSDQKVFYKHGIEAIDFQDRSGAKWAHSRLDTPERVKPHLLRQSCEIASGILTRIDRGQLETRRPYLGRVRES